MTARARPLVSVADLVRAIRRLDAPAAQWPAIAALLGMEAMPTVTPEPEPDPRPVPPGRLAPPSAPPQGGRSERPTPTRPTATAAASPAREAVPSVLRLVSDSVPAAPLWINMTTVLDEPESGDDGRAPPPLLEPAWQRGVLAELLMTAGDDGPIDVLGAVAVLARQEAFSELPRLPHPTLSRGAQVLVDVGPGLVPFTADQARVVRNLQRIAKPDALLILRFDRSPLAGAGRHGRPTWRSWRPPSPARPVLILSDIGAGPSGAPARAWRRTAEILRRAGCPAVVLCPYPAQRAPASVRRRLAIVEWDRATSARHVRAAVGGLMRVSP
jgi:hypothetical protein